MIFSYDKYKYLGNFLKSNIDVVYKNIQNVRF